MIAFIIPITVILITLTFYRNKKHELGLRESFLFASVTCAFLIFLSTKILSFFRLFSFGPLFFFWMLVASLSFFLIIKKAAPRRPLPFIKLKNLKWIEILLLFFIVFIVTMLAIVAFLAPPNTFDSMTYHMTRVAHWVEPSLRLLVQWLSWRGISLRRGSVLASEGPETTERDWEDQG